MTPTVPIASLVFVQALILVSAQGLSTLGKPAGFVERQVRGWSERWHRSRTTPLPEMDALAEWLRDHLPGDPPTPSIVHGDFKLDNVMIDPGDVGRYRERHLFSGTPIVPSS